MNINTKQGNSLSLLLVFPNDYNPVQAQDISLSIGRQEVARLSTNSITVVSGQSRQFRAQLTSSLMRRFQGKLPLEIAVDDSVLGVKRNIEAITLTVESSENSFNNSSINTATDATIQLSITSAGVTTNVTLATIYRGYSNYELDVQNGYEGTFEEWNNATNAARLEAAASATAAAEDRVIVAQDKGIVEGYKNTVNTDKEIVATDKLIVAADKEIVSADKLIVAADKATVIADKNTVAADKATVAADKATVNTDKEIVAADKAIATAKAAEALASAAAAQEIALGESTGYPSVRPTLLLDFANSRSVSPVVSFSRNSIGTYFDSKGIMQTAKAHVPRINFDPLTGECLGLLAEEERTNSLKNSQNFNSASWTGSGTSFSSNAIAPDLSTSFATITENTSTSIHAFSAAASNRPSLAGMLTFSVFLTQGTRRYVIVSFSQGSGPYMVVDTLNWVITQAGATGACVYTSSQLVSIGGGIYRAVLVGQVNAGATTIVTSIAGSSIPTPSAISNSYLGDSSTIKIWGAQLEAGAFATSYISTGATTVLRSAGLFMISGLQFSRFYNPIQGTLFVEMVSVGTGTNQGVFSLNDNTANNKTDFQVLGGAVAVSVAAAAQTVPSAIAATQNVWAKYAITYIAGTTKICKNGGVVNTGATVALPTVTQLQIGGLDGGTASNLNGYIKRLYYYPYVLSDSQLQALTA